MERIRVWRRPTQKENALNTSVNFRHLRYFSIDEVTRSAAVLLHASLQTCLNVPLQKQNSLASFARVPLLVELHQALEIFWALLPGFYFFFFPTSTISVSPSHIPRPRLLSVPAQCQNRSVIRSWIFQQHRKPFHGRDVDFND